MGEGRVGRMEVTVSVCVCVGASLVLRAQATLAPLAQPPCPGPASAVHYESALGQRLCLLLLDGFARADGSAVLGGWERSGEPERVEVRALS